MNLNNDNGPFAASHSRATKPLGWRAKVALGQDKQINAYIILDGNFLCLSCPSVAFALHHGGFVPRKWLATKGLLIEVVALLGLDSRKLSHVST